MKVIQENSTLHHFNKI